jgi:hypothetical protein
MIQRYHHGHFEDNYHVNCLEADDGNVVLFADHIAEVQRLAALLRQIVSSLPQKRDWLDPVVEREARALLDEMGQL